MEDPVPKHQKYVQIPAAYLDLLERLIIQGVRIQRERAAQICEVYGGELGPALAERILRD